MKFFKSIFYLNRLDRYILTLQIRPFLFFSSVLIGILWLVQSLPRLDDIITNGQSGDVFIKVAILMLPQVMLLVIPIAAFSATLYSVNQLFSDAEFIIFMSIGRSYISISKGIFVFGASVAIFMYLLSLHLVPISQQKLRALMFEVRQNLTGQLIKHGRFFHPSDGVSIYIRESNKNGEMRGIFLADARDPKNSLTYTAKEAVLHETQTGLLLVMQEGLLQIANNYKIELVTVSFDRLGLSLNDFFPKGSPIYLVPKEVPPLKIIYDFNAIEGVDHTKKNDYIAEAHLKLATPLTPIALTLLALTTFLITGYRRKGFVVPIYLGIFIGLIIQASTLSLRSVVSENNAFFWIIYSPPIFTIIITLFLISRPWYTKRKETKA